VFLLSIGQRLSHLSWNNHMKNIIAVSIITCLFGFGLAAEAQAGQNLCPNSYPGLGGVPFIYPTGNSPFWFSSLSDDPYHSHQVIGGGVVMVYQLPHLIAGDLGVCNYLIKESSGGGGNPGGSGGTLTCLQRAAMDCPLGTSIEEGTCWTQGAPDMSLRCPNSFGNRYGDTTCSDSCYIEFCGTGAGACGGSSSGLSPGGIAR
jgi:hypothetical protein